MNEEQKQPQAPQPAAPTSQPTMSQQPQVIQQYVVQEKSLQGLGGMLIFWMIVFYLVAKNIDPDKSGVAGKALFYLVAFFFLSAFFNLLLLGARRSFIGSEMAAHGLGLSLRQGILLAVLAVGLLILQSYRALFWWDGLLVLAGVFLIELYFLSRK